MQALAWQRLPMLRQIWRHHRDLGWRVLLKAPLESDQTARRQHIWYEVDELGASEVEAWPVVDAGTAEKRRPTRRHLNLSGISSFLLITPEGRWDPARLPELARRLKTPGGAS